MSDVVVGAFVLGFAWGLDLIGLAWGAWVHLGWVVGLAIALFLFLMLVTGVTLHEQYFITD